MVNVLKKLIVFTDGGARGNPGPGAIGILVLDKDGKTIARHSEFLGRTTNNQAEYSALIKALEICQKKNGTEIELHSDSELLVKQMNLEYKVREARLKELFGKAKQEEKKFQRVSYTHETRLHTNIRIVDKMLNAELDKHKS